MYNLLAISDYLFIVLQGTITTSAFFLNDWVTQHYVVIKIIAIFKKM